MHRKIWQACVASGLCTLVMLALCLLTSQAQSFYGAISGTVSDGTGAVVPGATVTVVNLGTNETRKATSNETGEYRFVNLVPANYKVTVEAKGFKSTVVQPIAVQVNNTSRVDAAVQPGAATETIQVTSEAALLQTESGTVGTAVEGQVVQSMPLNGRNAMDLITLTPGVVGGAYAATSGASSFNGINKTSVGSWDGYQIGGGFTNQNAQYIDGAPNNVLAGSTVAYVPTQDTVQEFRVDSSVPSAEFGRYGGGVIEMTTKSGTNAFHGSLYEYVRNTILNANTFFSDAAGLPKSPFHQNQFGVVVGGPIKKDKAFFFFNWEKFVLRNGTAITTNVPTAAQRNGVFTDKDAKGTARTIKDPSGKCTGITHDTVAGTYTIPSSCFDSTSMVMINYFPPANTNAAIGSGNYAAQPGLGDDTANYSARVDYNLNQKHRLFGRYTQLYLDDIGQNEFNNANGYITQYAATHDRSHQSVIGDTYTINPTTIGDLRASWTRQFFYNTPLSLGNVDLSKFGSAYATLAPQLSYDTYPNMTFSGNDSIYNLNPISMVVLDHFDNYALEASVTKIKGAHSFKFGGEGVLRLHNGIGSLNHNSAGFSTFTSTSGVGDEVAAFMLGEFTTDVITTVKASTTFNYSWGFYGTDTWKVNRNLTLNLGLRYELPGGMEEKKDRTTVLLPNTMDTATGYRGTIALVNSNLYGSRSMEPYQKRLLAPRISFAQSLPHSTVVRGGYGVAFLPPDIPIYLMAYSSPVSAVNTTAINPAVPIYFQSNPFPNGISQPFGRSNSNFTQKLLGQSEIVPVPSSNYPYMQQWDLSIGKQWKGEWETEISYVGTKGTHLAEPVAWGLDQVPSSLVTSGALQTMENNLISSGSSTSAARSAVNTYVNGTTATNSLRPYPYIQYTNLSDGAAYIGSSTYHAMYLILQKRFRKGGLINANYTWDKLLTDTDAPYGGNFSVGAQYAGPQDFGNHKSDKSIGDIEIAKRLLVNYVLNLPFGKDQRFGAGATGVTGHAISGWAVNGIATIQSGYSLPMSYNGNQLTSNLGAGLLRPNYVAGCNKMAGVPSKSYDKWKQKNWFNAACFTYPGDYSFGNEPRVDPTLRSQGLTDFDLSLSKDTTIKDNMTLQFRAESFNIFNHPFFNVPSTMMAGSNYNDINQQTYPPSPRLIQLSLRLNF